MHQTNKTGASRLVYWVAGIASLYALFQLGRGLYFAWISSYDLYLLYSAWSQVWFASTPGTEFHTAYLPHVLVFLSPLFVWGYPAARIIWLVCNCFFLGYSLWRLGRILSLDRGQHWLLCVLFCGWVAVRVTIGNGQISLACLAAVLTIYPYRGGMNQWGLVAGTIKHSLTLPLYVMLVFKRFRLLIIPGSVVLGLTAVVLWWGGWTPSAFLTQYQKAVASASADGSCTDFIQMFAAYFPGAQWPRILVAIAWVIGFLLITFYVRDEFIQIAMLLVMSLTPIYHRSYDLVILAPALALLIKHRGVLWPVLLSLSLDGIYEHLSKHEAYHLPWLEKAIHGYYPALAVVLLIALARLDREVGKAGAAAPV